MDERVLDSSKITCTEVMATHMTYRTVEFSKYCNTASGSVVPTLTTHIKKKTTKKKKLSFF